MNSIGKGETSVKSATGTLVEWIYETLADIFKWIREGKRSEWQLATLKKVLQGLIDNDQVMILSSCSLRDALKSHQREILQQAWQILYQKLDFKVDVEPIPRVWSDDFLRRQIHNRGQIPVYLSGPNSAYTPGWVFISKIKASRAESMADVCSRVAKRQKSGVLSMRMFDLPVILAWLDVIGRMSEKDCYMIIPDKGIIAYSLDGYRPVQAEEVPEKAQIYYFYMVCYSKFESGDDVI